MNPSAIYSKSGKGVQEASGKTSALSRGDRAVLSAFDGKMTLEQVADRVGKPLDAKFEQLVAQLDKDGFIRQVSAGAPAPSAKASTAARPSAKAPAAKAPGGAPGEDLDFTIAMPAIKPAAPAAPPVDLAAKARAEAERRAKEEEAVSYKARQEAEARAKKETEARVRAEAEAKAQAAAAARAQAEAAARAKAESDARLRAEAEAKAKAAEAERILAEADAKVKAAKEAALRLAAEAKARAEAELNAKLEAERQKASEYTERIRKEAEEKARRESEELRQRLEEERKAREEAERKAKEAEERRRKDEEERRAREEAEAKRRKEEEERRAREEAERRAKEEAERKAREEAEAKRRKEEEERRKKEEAERRAKEEAERKAREEAEAKRRKEEEERRAREEAERKARDEAEARRRREDDERRARDEADRKAREEADRKAREEADERRRKEDDERRRKEDEERRAREDSERRAREAREREDGERQERDERERREREERERAEREAAKAKDAKPADFADSLLADLDSFDKREEEERKAKEEADRKRKADKERRAREESERKEREEREEREAEERKRREKAEAERRRREEEEREREEAEAREREEAEARKRAAREALSEKAKDSAKEKARAAEDDDIGITDEDLDMDEVKRDEQAISKESRRAARERERDREREQERVARAPEAPAKLRRPVKWGKPVALAFFALLVGGIGLIHVMPISTAEYESAASEALGTPVKIGSAHISLITGVEVKMSNVTIGQAKLAKVRAYPEVGSLFNPKKSFSRIEIEEATVPQAALGAGFFAKAKGESFQVQRVVARKVKFAGPLALPPLDVDLKFGPAGEVRTATLSGGDGLLAHVTPNGSELEFDLNANTFTVPMASELELGQFGMKGTANREGIDVASWTSSLYDGVLNGTAKVTWRDGWSVSGVVTSRGVNAAVFAPTLLSEGKVDGTGRFSMSGDDPAKVASSGRLEGNFTVSKGAIGSVDLSRALSTGGRQFSGRTPFTELAGQGVYDKGAIALRSINITAGALNAGASADISRDAALSGRIVADVKTPSQTLRATLVIGGTVKEPQVKN